MKRIAFGLRKLADLFDPKVRPSTDNALTLVVNVDSAAAEQKVATLTAAMERLAEQSQKVNLA